MSLRALVGVIFVVAGIVGLVLSIVTFASNLINLMFWPFIGNRLPLSADGVGSYARGILTSFVGAPVSYLVMRFGWMIMSDS